VSVGDRVLDVGTGCGVLAIAAVLLGARHVAAVDVDPVAVEVAERNVAENGVAAAVTLRAGTLALAAPPEYDVVVANISSEANIGLAAAFRAALRPGGRLLVSGVLATDAERVAAAIGRAGLTLVARSVERDWSLLEFEG